uniref:Telomeric repeat-binding factor 1 n=1 Tax=Chelonoidis abingdonii TaxID=106734 RepID=A0A8C0H8G1_CHEAB
RVLVTERCRELERVGAGPRGEMDGEGEVSPGLFAETEAVAAGWMLEFSCYALCRHFREGRTRDFERSRDTAQAIINGLSKIATHQRKTVYLCQFLTRISEGKTLGYHFESDQRISPLESALSIWKLLEEEQSKPDKLHEDIHRLILIQAVAVHIERGYCKEATEVLERLFAESESNKLALIINGNNPDLPFLQSFSYNLLINKIKSYIDVFLKENSTNFLIKAATKEVETKRLEATISLNKPENTIETNNESNLETEQRFVTQTFYVENLVYNFSLFLKRWTWEEDSRLKDGVKKFGVGNWTKILIHYDFNNRTSVMLKDRWRTMIKKDIV